MRDRLDSYFKEYLDDATKPNIRNMFLLVILMLIQNSFPSVHFAHGHILSKIVHIPPEHVLLCT